MKGRRGLKYAIAIVAAGALLWFGLPDMPPRWNPWAPIRLVDPPNFLTGYKLQRLANDPARCRAILDGSDLRYQPVADRVTGPGCGFSSAVRVSGSGVAYGNSFVVTCPLAVGLALFERHALQPAAEETFGEAVAGIDHYGSYACRNVNGRASGRRSQHATANALDIAGFRLADGTRISVARDWTGDDAKAAFLHRLHDEACRIFSVVLGPDYNAAHRDHLHVDLGGFGLCR
jgi:hypothetical protein